MGTAERAFMYCLIPGLLVGAVIGRQMRKYITTDSKIVVNECVVDRSSEMCSMRKISECETNGTK